MNYEAFEARAFGLMLADLTQRLDIGFEGMEHTLDAQKELLLLVQLCCSGAPARRPCFGEIRRKLASMQRSAANHFEGVVAQAGSTPGGSTLSTPRSGAVSVTPLSASVAESMAFSMTPESTFDTPLSGAATITP